MRRKDAYEALHPETKHGTNQHSRSGQDGQPSFAEDQAEKTGEASRTVRLNAEPGIKSAGPLIQTHLIWKALVGEPQEVIPRRFRVARLLPSSSAKAQDR